MNSKNDFEYNNFKDSSQTEVSGAINDGLVIDTQLPVAPPGTHAPRRKPLMWLIVSNPPEQRGTVLPIADGTIIGRHGDIPWQDARMSRRHARFILIDNPDAPGEKLFAIKPEKDLNGTVVNGHKIKTITPLYENNVIIMGDTRFVVKVLE